MSIENNGDCAFVAIISLLFFGLVGAYGIDEVRDWYEV